jgi:single-strand DNA-binding protein
MYSNRAMITGFQGNDAQSRTTRNNSSFTTFSVATKRSWKNRDTGEYESQTTWHRCVVYAPQAAFAATLLKGAHLW